MELDRVHTLLPSSPNKIVNKCGEQHDNNSRAPTYYHRQRYKQVTLTRPS